MKILIMENGDWLNSKVTEIFNKKEQEVCIKVNNGKKGLEAIKKFNPDIVFADIKLSDVSGIDMINKGKNYMLAKYIYGIK